MAQAMEDLDMVVDGHCQFIDVFDRGDVAAAKALITEHVIKAKDRILDREEA
jgi:DNA-binding GntR family transcriptional regulator